MLYVSYIKIEVKNRFLSNKCIENYTLVIICNYVSEFCYTLIYIHMLFIYSNIN